MDLSANCFEKQVFVKHLTGWRLGTHLVANGEFGGAPNDPRSATGTMCVISSSWRHSNPSPLGSFAQHDGSSPHWKGRNGRNPSYTAAGPQLSSTSKCRAPPVTMNHLPVTVSHLLTQSRLSLSFFFFFYFWEDKHPWPCSSNQLPCCSAKISAHIPVNTIDAKTAHVILTVKKCFIKLQLPDDWQVEWWS